MATKTVRCPGCSVILGPETTVADHDQGCKLVISAREGIKVMKEGRSRLWSEIRRELGIEDSEATVAETTPIEVLERALRGWVLAEAQLGHPAVDLTDARAALEDVRALTKVLEALLAWGERADAGPIPWREVEAQARTVLDKFKEVPL